MSRDNYEAAVSLAEAGLSNEAFRIGCMLTSDDKELVMLAEAWPMLYAETLGYAKEDAARRTKAQPEAPTKEE